MDPIFHRADVRKGRGLVAGGAAGVCGTGGVGVWGVQTARGFHEPEAAGGVWRVVVFRIRFGDGMGIGLASDTE